MNEIEFTIWLKSNKTSNKLCSDYVSRIKRIERSILDCDIDDEYDIDHCEHLLSLFQRMGKGEEMQSRMIGDLPIGKYQLAAFPYAIRKYVNFKNETTKLKQK